MSPGDSRMTYPVDVSILAGARRPAAGFLIHPVGDRRELAAYRKLRRELFVGDQQLFAGTDADEIDDDPRTVVLVATASDGGLLGGVRLAPVCDPDVGWWTGSRLVTTAASRGSGVGAALVRAACGHAESAGALRFEATVQRRHAGLFTALGWTTAGQCEIAGVPHVLMRWPVQQLQHLADATKSFLGEILTPLRATPGGLGPAGFVGDDGVPIPGSDIVAACDAIIPSMVERDPEWAGWCSVLVNVNDLTAMGATPVGLLDAVAAPTRSLLTRVIRGIARASQMWSVPVLGGHTQLGVPAALSVTAFGRSVDPIPAGGGAAGDSLHLIADLAGGWRAGQRGRQWDSSSTRSRGELTELAGLIARVRPRAAKDVSMAGIVGTVGMLAEAGGTGSEIDVAAVPRPTGIDLRDWLTCFPGYAMLTAGPVERETPPLPTGVVVARCGRLTAERGVRLRWPDGETTTAIEPAVTGLERA